MADITLERAIEVMVPVWDLDRWVTDPAAARKYLLGTMAGAGTREGSFKVTSKGIECVPRGGSRITFTWARVIERIQGFPPGKVARLAHLNRLSREHQASFVPWRASAAAQGCGRVNGEGPLTEKQALYEQEYDEWWEKHARPHYDRSADLTRKRQELLAEMLAEKELTLWG